MNYMIFLLRGSQYAHHAVSLWRIRKDNLISFWCSEDRVDKKNRADFLIKEIESRIKNITLLFYKFKEQQQHDRSRPIMISLDCGNFSCNESAEALAVMINMKDYVPGKHKCNICGDPLSAPEEREIEYQLRKVGLKS